MLVKVSFDATSTKFAAVLVEIFGVTLVNAVRSHTFAPEMQNGLEHNFHNDEASNNTEISTIISSNFEIRVKPLDRQQFDQNSVIEEYNFDIHDECPPSKKRKLASVTSPQRSTSRHASPPWKRIAVDGPTSFVEGGRRKSSRTNTVPLELQPQSDKRRTRGAIQHSPAIRSKYGGKSLQKSLPLTALSTQTNNGKRKYTKRTTPAASKSPAKLHSQHDGLTNGHNSSCSTPRRSHKKWFSSARHPSSSPQPGSSGLHKTRGAVRFSTNTKMSLRVQEPVQNGWNKSDEEFDREDDDDDDDDEEEEDDDVNDTPVDPNFRPQRLNLRVNMPTVTIQHPAHVVPPRKYPSFRDWLRNDDPLDGSDANHLTEREARREARVRQRIVEAAEPGGVLSVEKCSVYIPEAQEEPPQQYAHQDHLLAHAIYFRKLMNKEHRDHISMARKISNAAVEKWRQNDPWSIAEAGRRYWDTTYRPTYIQCLKDLLRKWELIRGEVNLHRLKKWEEEQDAIGKKALGKMLEKSSRLMRRRRGSSMGTSPIEDEEDGDSGNEASGSDQAGSEPESEDEKNMSSSQSESEEGLHENVANEDDGLTVDEIRRKYADQPTENLDRPPDLVSVQSDVALVCENNTKSLFSKEKPEELEDPSLSIEEPEDPSLSIEVAHDDPQEYPSEMDEQMLDESDESTDMNDDMGDTDQSSGNEELDGEESDIEVGRYQGLLGLLPEEELQIVIDKDKNEPGVEHAASDEEIEEVSLIPDATQVQTPSASNSEAPSIDIRKEIKRPPIYDESRMQIDHPGADSKLSIVKSSPLATLTNLDQVLDIEANSLPATPISTKPVRMQVPPLLRGTLREYQQYGLEWLAGLYANGTNGILADEMGLGKTIQTISLLAHLAVEHEIWGPHLIIVPTSVMLNWEMEFKKFLPGFKVLTYYGTQEERKQKRKGWLDNDKWNVCITSYQLVLQDQQAFKRRAWHYLVLDEAHNIKNFRSQRWQTLLTFRTRARLLLTGTPLQNNLTELWSLLFFLMPSDSTETGIAGFAGLQDFTSWFKKPVDQILEQGRETMDDEAKELVHRLHGVLRPFLLRRLKADVEKQMPGKYEHVVYCKLSKRQRYLYDGFMSRTQTRETLARGNYLSIINCLMQLRKVCNHPDLFETRQIVTSFAMPKSVMADFEIKDLLIRRRLLQEDPMQIVNLDVVNLLPGANGPVSALDTIQNSRLGALYRLRKLATDQRGRILPNMQFNGTTTTSTLAYMENQSRISAMEKLSHTAYLTNSRSQRRPLYGYGLKDRLSVDVTCLPSAPRPKRRSKLIDWLSSVSPAMQEMVLTLPSRSEAMRTTVQKFACITPKVVAHGVNELALTHRGIEIVQEAKQICPEDSFHEARIRLSIAFPDKRLLQYDCGKLQRLDALLRTLQSGGHRALIFTQMTKVLDILEQFLNIHGHRYLRLDGATKIEQRQILTDRFNNDNRILAFILSSRSGGLGINLTGADTVIFYDLDWNPAMDKQCQDRCHRIGQTRDVHIYRFVSEHTIEANILRKANQKRLLDEVIIQEGDFTTDHFNQPGIRDTLDDESLGELDAEASAAMDRVLGAGSGNNKLSGKIFEQAEDKEDIDAAKVAEKEMAQVDDADFDERTASGGVGTPKTPGPQPSTPGNVASKLGLSKQAASDFETTAEAAVVDDETFHSALTVPSTAMSAEIFSEKQGIGVDHYMVEFLEHELEDVPVMPLAEKVKTKAKKAVEHVVKKAK